MKGVVPVFLFFFLWVTDLGLGLHHINSALTKVSPAPHVLVPDDIEQGSAACIQSIVLHTSNLANVLFVNPCLSLSPPPKKKCVSTGLCWGGGVHRNGGREQAITQIINSKKSN